MKTLTYNKIANKCILSDSNECKSKVVQSVKPVSNYLARIKLMRLDKQEKIDTPKPEDYDLFGNLGNILKP